MIKKEKHLTQFNLTKVRLYKAELVRMNSKNEKHFSCGLNIQVCELLQVLKEANIKRCFEKISVLGILKDNK